MENADAALFSARAYKGDRPMYFADPDVDRLLAMILALTGELAVTRERLETVERLLEAGGNLSQQAIEDYEPDTDETQARLASHEALIARVLRIVHQEIESLKEASA